MGHANSWMCMCVLDLTTTTFRRKSHPQDCNVVAYKSPPWSCVMSLVTRNVTWNDYFAIHPEGVLWFLFASHPVFLSVCYYRDVQAFIILMTRNLSPIASCSSYLCGWINRTSSSCHAIHYFRRNGIMLTLNFKITLGYLNIPTKFILVSQIYKLLSLTERQAPYSLGES